MNISKTGLFIGMLAEIYSLKERWAAEGSAKSDIKGKDADNNGREEQ